MMTISLKKQRKINTSKLSLTGGIFSVKLNDIIEFESSLERDFIYIAEYDNQVIKYMEQPLKIWYYHDNIKKCYVPDFWVEYNNGKKEIVEIKYKDDIEKPSEELFIKLLQADKFCKANNLDFKVLTENEIRTPYLKNAKFLLYYKLKGNLIKESDINLIFSKFKELKYSNASEIINLLSTNFQTKAQYLFVLWYLVSIDIIFFDNTKNLTMNSPLWIK